MSYFIIASCQYRFYVINKITGLQEEERTWASVHAPMEDGLRSILKRLFTRAVDHADGAKGRMCWVEVNLACNKNGISSKWPIHQLRDMDGSEFERLVTNNATHALANKKIFLS